jgi:hypothetical protein
MMFPMWSSDQAWSLVALGGIVFAIVIGFPRLLGGGGKLRRGGRRGGRGGRYTIRTGPRPSVALALVLVRRLDGVVLAGATAAFAVLLVVNARS